MKLCLFLFCFVIYTCNNEENEENKREGKEFIHVNNEENEEKKREGKQLKERFVSKGICNWEYRRSEVFCVSTYWPSSHFVEREFPLLSSRVLSLVFFVFASVLHLFVINICFL